jgi:uncharacterized Zn finger protein
VPGGEDWVEVDGADAFADDLDADLDLDMEEQVESEEDVIDLKTPLP